MGSMTVTIPSLALGVQDAAFELGCSTDFIRARIKAGDLPASKVAGRILIRRDDLEQLLSRTRL
jgi:excisionase family DNA binding protein